MFFETLIEIIPAGTFAGVNRKIPQPRAGEAPARSSRQQAGFISASRVLSAYYNYVRAAIRSRHPRRLE